MDFQSRNVMIIPQLCDNFIITINPMVSFVFFRKIEKKKEKRGIGLRKRGGTRPCSIRKLCLRLSDLYLYIHKLNIFKYSPSKKKKISLLKKEKK